MVSRHWPTGPVFASSRPGGHIILTRLAEKAGRQGWARIVD